MLHNNRVAFSLDGSNAIIIMNAMDYFPYGKILREFDNGNGNRYLTMQHERDKETGLDYRGARYYDSDVARFLSLDPLAAKYPAWSAYNYVMGNPVKLIDPNGKEVETDPPGKKRSILNILPQTVTIPRTSSPSPKPKSPQSTPKTIGTSPTKTPIDVSSGILSLTTVTLSAEDQQRIISSTGPVVNSNATAFAGVNKKLINGSNSLVDIGLKTTTTGDLSFSIGTNGVSTEFGRGETTVSFAVPFTNTTFDLGQKNSGISSAAVIGFTTTNSDNSYYGLKISVEPNETVKSVGAALLSTLGPAGIAVKAIDAVAKQIQTTP